jgi:hypothetical protein
MGTEYQLRPQQSHRTEAGTRCSTSVFVALEITGDCWVFMHSETLLMTYMKSYGFSRAIGPEENVSYSEEKNINLSCPFQFQTDTVECTALLTTS